jgi:hypothetical protein
VMNRIKPVRWRRRRRSSASGCHLGTPLQVHEGVDPRLDRELHTEHRRGAVVLHVVLDCAVAADRDFGGGRPDAPGQFPVLMSMSPYSKASKAVHFQAAHNKLSDVPLPLGDLSSRR